MRHRLCIIPASRNGYTYPVTAKEALHDAIDEMSEAEAAALLQRVRRPLTERVPWLRGRGDMDAALRSLDRYWEANRDISDEEVAEYDRMLANIEPVRFREWRPE